MRDLPLTPESTEYTVLRLARDTWAGAYFTHADVVEAGALNRYAEAVRLLQDLERHGYLLSRRGPNASRYRITVRGRRALNTTRNS